MPCPMQGGVVRLSFGIESVQQERDAQAVISQAVSALKAKGIAVAGHMHTDIIGGKTFVP